MLIDDFVKEFQKEVLGEEHTIKFLLLVISSRWVHNKNSLSYHTMLNSESGTGKDFVLQKVMRIIEPEYYTGFTRISSRALDYLNPRFLYPDKDDSWDGKFIGLEDIESEILNSSTLKVFLSNGSKTAIVNDGKVQTTQHKGSPIVLMTSAYSDPNKELMRRINILMLDESDNQTYNILLRQAGCDDCCIDYDSLKEKIRDYKQYKVLIPYAGRLANIISHNGTHMRTFFPRFMDFIKSSAVFHQNERSINNGFVYANGDDYNIVKTLFEGLSITKKFNPISRNKMELLHTLEYEFQGDWFNTKEASQILNKSYNGMFKIIKSYVENDMLETKEEFTEWSKKPIYYYKPKEPERLKLPDFEELFKNDE